MRKTLFTFLVVMMSVVAYAEDFNYPSSNYKYHVTTTALDDYGDVDYSGFFKVDSILAKTIFHAMQVTNKYQMSNFYYSMDADSVSCITYKSEYDKEVEGNTFDAKQPWATYLLKKISKKEMQRGCYYICSVSYTKKETQAVGNVTYTFASVAELGGMTRMSSVTDEIAAQLSAKALAEISTVNANAKFYYCLKDGKYWYYEKGEKKSTEDGAEEGGRYICDIKLTSGTTATVGDVTYKIGIAGLNNRLPGICSLFKATDANNASLKGLIYATVSENGDTTYYECGSSSKINKAAALGKKYLCGYTIKHVKWYSEGREAFSAHLKKYGQYDSHLCYYYSSDTIYDYRTTRGVLYRSSDIKATNDDHIDYYNKTMVDSAASYKEVLHNASVKNMLDYIKYDAFSKNESTSDGTTTITYDLNYRDYELKNGEYTPTDHESSVNGTYSTVPGRKYKYVDQAIRDYFADKDQGNMDVNKVRHAYDMITKADIDSLAWIDNKLDDYYNLRSEVAYFADTCSFAQAPTLFTSAVAGPDAMISTALGFADNIKNVGVSTPISLIDAAINALKDLKTTLAESIEEATEDELSVISAVSSSMITTAHAFPSVHDVTIPKTEVALYFLSATTSLANHIKDFVAYCSSASAAITAATASLGGQAGIAMGVAGIVAEGIVNAAMVALDIRWGVKAGLAVAKLYQAASWLNYQCTSSETAHAYFADAVQKCRSSLSGAPSAAAVSGAQADLVFAWERAKALNDLAPVQIDMTYLISEYTEIANNMETLTNTGDTPHYAKGNLRKAIAWAQNEKDQIREYDIVYGSDYKYNYNTDLYPSTRLKKAMSILTEAKDIFTRQYAIEQVYEQATDSVKSLSFYADPKYRLRMARVAADKGLNIINNIKLDNNNQTTLDRLYKVYTCADTTYTNLSNSRKDAIARNKQICDTLTYVTGLRDNLLYYATDTVLTNSINKYVTFMKTVTTAARVDSMMLDICKNARYIANHDDFDTVYLLYVIEQGEKCYEANYDKYTEYQRNIFTMALSMAHIVKDEYNSLYHDPSHERFYYAIWAVDYAMLMTPANTDMESKEYKHQLAESLALVASYFNALYYDSTGQVMTAEDKTVYDEAMAIYNNAYSSDEELSAARVRVLALMKDNSTGIQSVSGNANATRNGKYVENGRIVIMNNGKKYNAAGAQIK